MFRMLLPISGIVAVLATGTVHARRHLEAQEMAA